MHKKSNKIKNSLRKLIPYNLRKYFKFIPIIGLIILIALHVGVKGEEAVSQPDVPIMDKLEQAWQGLIGSFNFSDNIQTITTIVLLITIWTGYKYWLRKWKYVRRNSKLLEKLIIASMVLIFVNYHIRISSTIGEYVDWGIFLLFLYLVVAGSWFLAKTIDGIDLRSDLYCWGLRIVGLVTIFFGFMLFGSSTFVLAFDSSDLVFNNIYWIASVCIILLGVFMEYRSVRRHPAIHIW